MCSQRSHRASCSLHVQCRTVLQHGLRQQPIWQLAFNHAAWEGDAPEGSPLLLAARCSAWVVVLRVSWTEATCATHRHAEFHLFAVTVAQCSIGT